MPSSSDENPFEAFSDEPGSLVRIAEMILASQSRANSFAGSEHFVEHGSDAEDVAAKIKLFCSQLFWRPEPHCSLHQTDIRKMTGAVGYAGWTWFLLNCFRESEINILPGPAAVSMVFPGLYVAMGNPVAMRFRECTCDLLC
jgi:hypothetical protein